MKQGPYVRYIIFQRKISLCDFAENRDKTRDTRLIENSFSSLYYPLPFFEHVAPNLLLPFKKNCAHPSKIHFFDRASIDPVIREKKFKLLPSRNHQFFR